MHNPHIGDTILGHPHIKTLEQASTHVQVYEIMTRSDYKTISGFLVKKNNFLFNY